MSVAPLEQFVRSKMRMSHIYQPTMLQVLVRNGGQATRRQIASEFLKHDESQLEYYEHITAKMPGRVLKSHGIIELTEDGYALTGVHRKLREGDRRTILQLCRDKIAEFKAERGPDEGSAGGGLIGAEGKALKRGGDQFGDQIRHWRRAPLGLLVGVRDARTLRGTGRDSPLSPAH